MALCQHLGVQGSGQESCAPHCTGTASYPLLLPLQGDAGMPGMDGRPGPEGFPGPQVGASAPQLQKIPRQGTLDSSSSISNSQSSPSLLWDLAHCVSRGAHTP